MGETPIRTCSLVFYPRGSYCREIYFGGDRAIPVGEAGASRARGPSETSEGTQPEVFPGSSIIDGTTMVIFVRSSPPVFPRPYVRTRTWRYKLLLWDVGVGADPFGTRPRDRRIFWTRQGKLPNWKEFLCGWRGFQGGYGMIMDDFLFLIHNSIAQIVT